VIYKESLAYTPGQKSIVHGAEKVPLRVAVCSEGAAPSTAQATTSDRKPACDPALQTWVDCADDLFHGKGSFYGFIVSTDNSYTGECPDRYGYECLYERVKEKADYRKVDEIKGLRGGKARLTAYELGFIREGDVYAWFSDLVHRQNNRAAFLRNPEGKQIIAQDGRFCNRKGRRSVQIQKAFKEGIAEITDCILLTLTTHEKEVRAFMPDNTNLLPVQFATVNVGKWISVFVNRLRQFQRVRGIPWEFVGWTVEFQEGEKDGPDGHHGDPFKMHNGFPHVHMIFRGKWIGAIREIAALWPYSEPQGVDYLDRAKYERRLRSQGKLAAGRRVAGVRLINYVTAYVSKCSKAVVVKDGKAYVHKGYAWLAFVGGRMFSVAREYKRERSEDERPVKKERTFQEKYGGPRMKEGWSYEGVRMYTGEETGEETGVSGAHK